MHGFENTNICIVWRDWDEDTGTVKECKIRRRYVLAEMILTMLVKAAVHALMVTPIFMTGMNNTFGGKVEQNQFLGFKILKRHEILAGSIGFFKEEQDSLHNVSRVAYIVLWTIPPLTVLEMVIYILYQLKVKYTKLCLISV